jgi:hypothetical protein
MAEWWVRKGSWVGVLDVITTRNAMTRELLYRHISCCLNYCFGGRGNGS